MVKRFFVFLTILFASFSALADRVYNMTRGVTTVSEKIYDLHMIIFWICVAIGIVTFGVMIYALIFHRKSRGHEASKFHEHPVLEAVWAIAPFIILVAMAIPATKVMMEMEDSSEAAVTIKVTGFQWKWKYDYLDQGVSFFSNLATNPDEIHNKVEKNKWYLLEVDKPLVVPVNQKIRFLITANDVIHSWWVPALGIKKDGVPGFIHEAWAFIKKPGTYRGQCAELCGINHAYMPIVVKAVSDEEFKIFVAENAKQAKPDVPAAPMTKTELMKIGKQTYTTTCSVCHKPDGTGLPPAFPSMVGSAISVGPKDKHIDVVVNGVPGTAMQAFKEQLSDEELAAVLTYERNVWGNDDQAKHGKDAGGLVQPSDIEKSKS